MKKTLAVLTTVAAVGTAAVVAPSPAEARGIGPGLAFGLAAGAITAGALAATSPYYYGHTGITDHRLITPTARVRTPTMVVQCTTPTTIDGTAGIDKSLRLRKSPARRRAFLFANLPPLD